MSDYGPNVFTGGIPSANAAEGGHEASHAFDGVWDNPDNRWYGGAGGGPPSFLEYDLNVGVTKKVAKIVFQVWSVDYSYHPEDFTIEGSNNEADWDTLDTIVAASYSLGQRVSLEFSNTTGYRYYRMYITATVAGAPPIIQEMEGYEIAEAGATTNYLKYYRRPSFPV